MSAAWRLGAVVLALAVVASSGCNPPQNPIHMQCASDASAAMFHLYQLASPKAEPTLFAEQGYYHITVESPVKDNPCKVVFEGWVNQQGSTAPRGVVVKPWPSACPLAHLQVAAEVSGPAQKYRTARDYQGHVAPSCAGAEYPLDVYLVVTGAQ
jgi:hypothetical protein